MDTDYFEANEDRWIEQERCNGDDTDDCVGWSLDELDELEGL